MDKEISRRSFLKTGAAAAIGLSVAPDLIFQQANISACRQSRNLYVFFFSYRLA